MNNQAMPTSIFTMCSSPKVSVIVPVYNTGRYVERALVSLFEQTLSDIQFIIINDGSKDDSLAIIEAVIARYPGRQAQVILINRENRGVAATRSQGLALARGDYVIHMDSDDWAEPNWLEVMHARALADGADVVVCDYLEEFDEHRVASYQHVAAKGLGCVARLLTGDIFNPNWNKLVRRKIFVEHNIDFANDIKMGEDFLVSLAVFIHADTVSYCADKLYHYNRTNEYSLTILFDNNSLADLLIVTEHMMTMLHDSGCMSDADIAQAVAIFKLNIRNMYVLKSIGRHDYKHLALRLYPETDGLLHSGLANRSLRLVWFLHRHRLDWLFTVVDGLMVVNGMVRRFLSR